MNKSVLSFSPFFFFQQQTRSRLYIFFSPYCSTTFSKDFFLTSMIIQTICIFYLYVAFFPCETFTSLSLFIQNFAFYCIAVSSAFFLLSHCNIEVPPKDKFQYGLFVYIYKYTCLLMVMIMMIFS